MKKLEFGGKMKEIPIFIIDGSALVGMIEKQKKNKAGDLLKMLQEVKKKTGKPFFGVAPMISLLQAIHKVKPETPIGNLQEILEVIRIIPSDPTIDYKDDKKVIDHVVKLAEGLSKAGGENESRE